MKKVIFTLLTSALLGSAVQAQFIENGGFEDWRQYQGFGGAPYNDLGSDSIRTDDFLRTLNEILDAPGTPATAFRTTQAADVYSGSSAIRLVTGTFGGAILVPGFVGTGDVDLGNTTIYLGRPFNTRPASLTAWYKYEPTSGDSASFYVLLTKYDALNQTRDTIGEGYIVIRQTVSSWTNLSLPINYVSTETPDSIVVIAASSAGYNLVNLQGSVGQVGSRLFLDDMGFTYPASVEEVNSGKVSAYPTLTNGWVNITTKDTPNQLNAMVYDINGRLVSSQKISGTQTGIDMSGMTNGTYILIVQDAFNLYLRTKLVKM